MNNSSTPPELLCIGGASLDVILRTPRLPAHGEKQLVEYAGRSAGGLVANTACAAGRLGLSTAWYGALGDDESGQYLAENFSPFGVDSSHAQIVPGTATDFCTVMITPNGERTILVANTLPSPPPLPPIRDLLCSVPMVYTLPYQLDWFHQLADLVHTCRGLVAVDIETSAPLQTTELRRAMEWVDIAFFSRSGMRKHIGSADLISAGKTVLSWGPRVVIITLGKDGAFACTPETVQYSPGFAVRPVDTTGAGDCFHAAFLYAIRKKMPLDAALRFANGAAALSIQFLGARSGFPDRETVDVFLRENLQEESSELNA